MKNLFSLSRCIICCLFFMPAFCMAANESAISEPRHEEQLNELLQSAKKLQDKNLNRFSMEVLYRYDKAFDTIFQAEKRDTLARISAQFDKDSHAKRHLSDSLDSRVKKLSVEKEELRQKYFSLLRKAVIALIIWLVVVTLILYFRTKAMRRYKHLESKSELSLSTYQMLNERGESFLRLSDSLTPVEVEISGSHQALLSFHETLKQQVKSGQTEASQVKGIQNKLSVVLASTEIQDSIIQAVKIQRETESDTKIETDVNVLCKYYLDLATAGLTNESLDCKVSTDFEKRIPKIKMFPQAIGNMLNNLFANSFQSMQAKMVIAGKGYKPTLTMSTRVLPRFIQIRIKDNGAGIQDSELERVFDYYYSLQPAEQGAGLGLAEAKRIMKEMHNGEISIESDNERGTDVYLKFFTSNEKS